MPSKDELTPSESAILVLLMSENRRIQNPELKKVFGFELKKESRDKLNRLKLVVTSTEGGVMVHQLGDAAWDRLQTPLNFKGVRPQALGAALGSLLTAVRRDLEANGRSLAIAFAPEVAEPATPLVAAVDLVDRIRETYSALASAPRAWVSIGDIRRKLDDVPRSDLDAALRRLEQAADANIVPESNQKTLSEDERAAAVIIGDQPKHLLAIGV